MTKKKLHHWSDEQIAAFWDHESKFPENYWGKNCARGFISIYKDLITKSKIICDVGCGEGSLMQKILAGAKSDQSIFGIEPSSLSRTAAFEACNEYPQFSNVYDSADSFLQENNSPDLIILSEVIEHLYDEQLTILFADVLKLMSPKTVLIITTPNNENLEKSYIFNPIDESLFHRWQHVRTWTAGSLTKYLESTGFTTIVPLETNILWYNSNPFKNLYRRLRYREKTSLFCVVKR